MTAISTRSPRARLRALVDGFQEHDLLTCASAISFQILTALVPALMFVFGLLGFLSLGGVWRNELGPDIKGHVSPPAFAVIDDAVTKALTRQQLFWVTIGLLIALWQLSGAVRAVAGALNRVYRLRPERSFRQRMGVSIALAVALGACWLGAIASVVLGPLLYDGVPPVLNALLFIGRWAVAAALLLIGVALVLHFAPEHEQPVKWVTRGTLLIIGAWVVMSIGFGFYLREIASYDSIFGSLATIVVLTAYLYLSAIVFLGGVQVDALARPR